jgi:GNAT superfamily N-acetyltransferase
MMNLTITNTRPEHLRTLETISAPDKAPGCFEEHHFLHHLRRFPEGQFTALLDGKPVAYAITMRTHYSPYDPPRGWMKSIGDMTLRNHNPDGEWLYGVDFCVHPDYRRCGIGTKMYQERFKLVKRLNLQGFYVGGMLAGYHRYQHFMTVQEYAQNVIRGEIEDPTVTMQMNRGFKPRALIENYIAESPALANAMLLLWLNPVYQPVPLAALA